MARITRRRLLQSGALAGASIALPLRFGTGARAAAATAAPLDPSSIDQYAATLIVPPAMPRTSRLRRRGKKDVDYYEIAVRQFDQQILPPGMPRTTVWSYGSANHPATFNYPAFTIEARHGRPVRVKWINGLVDRDGGYLPHLLPVDPTLHWANPREDKRAETRLHSSRGRPAPTRAPSP
jgi:FtsP/CotA-like multicopper oxidase with cupredoxin domain